MLKQSPVLLDIFLISRLLDLLVMQSIDLLARWQTVTITFSLAVLDSIRQGSCNFGISPAYEKINKKGAHSGNIKTSELELTCQSGTLHNYRLTPGFRSEHPIYMINIPLKELRRPLSNDTSTTFLALHRKQTTQYVHNMPPTKKSLQYVPVLQRFCA